MLYDTWSILTLSKIMLPLFRYPEYNLFTLPEYNLFTLRERLIPIEINAGSCEEVCIFNFMACCRLFVGKASFSDCQFILSPFCSEPGHIFVR